jgi:DNA-binding helix-hairpin-helix protein with protein kinase domain
MAFVCVTYLDGTTEEYDADPIGQGAQGVILKSRDQRSAAKLYFDNGLDPAVQAALIDRLINELNPTKDDPYWDEFFSWPNKLIIRPGIGYRMRLAQGMHTLDTFLFPKTFNTLRPEERGWFMGRVASAIKLVSAAQRMSTKGICYPDFSHRNIMVEPFEGRMTLIDCDSITVPSMMPAMVVGTPLFMAPELNSQQQRIPDVKTDRHALAVILYLYLLGSHPLLGDKVHDPNDPERDDALRLGRNALYVEDVHDTSNRATGQTIFARHLGYEMEETFKEAFSVGLHHPDKRPQPQQWLTALTRVYDRIIPCETTTCWWHSFVALPGGNIACPVCKAKPKNVQALPFLYLLPYGNKAYDEIMDRNKHHVVGWPGRTLHEWHTTMHKTPLHTTPEPQRDTHATFLFDGSSNTWYLRNERLNGMLFQDANRQWQPVGVGASVPLTQGMALQFGPEPNFKRAKISMISV